MGQAVRLVSPLLDHLLHRYGANLTEIVELCDADPSLAVPLEHAPAYLRAEVHYAVSHEGALHLEDVLAHRTRLVYEVPDRGTGAAEEVAALVAPLLGWDASDTERELRSWQARIDAERHAEQAPDDETAEQARLTTPDVAAMQPLRS
nr:hypothetical protein GCM10025730_26770 [Promicromonospora thailandica]